MSQYVNSEEVSRILAGQSAEEIINWAVKTFGDGLVASTSFGIGSAPILHLLTAIAPGIPVVFVDTGYNFPETLSYAEQLTELLQLNVKTVRATETAAEMEARFGRLWERDIALYHHRRKILPLQRALEELRATAWIAGLRASETSHRATLPLVQQAGAVFKVFPTLYWDDKAVQDYIELHQLPDHPLVSAGYRSIGDWHSSRLVAVTDRNIRQTRFGGVVEECGLHLPDGTFAG